MKNQRNTTYNLEEAAQLTGYAQRTLRRAVDAGDLAAAEGEDAATYRISGVELERWYLGVEGGGKDLFAGQAGREAAER